MTAPARVGAGDLAGYLKVVRVPKECPECGDEFDGNMFAGYVDKIPRTPTRRIVGWCDGCIDRWAANLRLRDLGFRADELQRSIEEATRRPARRNLLKSLEAVLREMADLAESQRRAKLLIQLDQLQGRRERLEAAMENAV